MKETRSLLLKLTFMRRCYSPFLPKLYIITRRSQHCDCTATRYRCVPAHGNVAYPGDLGKSQVFTSDFPEQEGESWKGRQKHPSALNVDKGANEEKQHFTPKPRQKSFGTVQYSTIVMYGCES